MAILAELSQFDTVYQLEVTDSVVGGVNGTANTQAKNLTNRTKYLKDKLEETQKQVMAAGKVLCGMTDGPDVTAQVGQTLFVQGEISELITPPNLIVLPNPASLDGETITIINAKGSAQFVSVAGGTNPYNPKTGTTAAYSIPNGATVVFKAFIRETGETTSVRNWMILSVS
jgi:hypothetical protein